MFKLSKNLVNGFYGLWLSAKLSKANKLCTQCSRKKWPHVQCG